MDVKDRGKTSVRVRCSEVLRLSLAFHCRHGDAGGGLSAELFPADPLSADWRGFADCGMDRSLLFCDFYSRHLLVSVADQPFLVKEDHREQDGGVQEQRKLSKASEGNADGV